MSDTTTAVWNVRCSLEMKRHTIAALLAAATSAAAGALACSDASAPNVRTLTSFGIRPPLDTATVGDTVVFVAERADSTVDAWTLSDTSAQLLVSQGARTTVLAQTPGTVTLTATRQGDSGQATLVILAPPPEDLELGIRPALDTAVVGDLVEFFSIRAGFDHWILSADAWVLSDSSLARFITREGGAAVVAARAPGTVTVTATRDGDSAHATLVIRQLGTAEGWEIVNLGLVGAFSGEPHAINDSGTIVGRISRNWDSSTSKGFVYRDGVVRKLLGPVAPTAIGPSGRIVGVAESSQLLVWDSPDAAPRLLAVENGLRIIGVNARGDILARVGDRTLGTYLRARLWRNDVPEDLGTLTDTVTAPKSFPTAWNRTGQIVGGSKVDQFYASADRYETYHPFLWEDGVMRDLGVLGSVPCEFTSTPRECGWGEATGINANGVVVGNSGVGRLWRAFIWEKGVMRDLGVFPGHNTFAWAINDRGQVLGGAGSDTTFFWDNGEMQIVQGGGRLLGPNGEVVGTMVVAGDSVPHAFIWLDGQSTDLGQGSPVAMNSRGEIIGTRGSIPTLWRKKQQR